MLGASKIAYQSLIKLVDSNKNLHSIENGESILLLADAITGSKTLLTTLTDSGISPEARAGVAKDVLAKIGTNEAVSLISEAVKMRWSETQDLVQGMEASGARALFAICKSIPFACLPTTCFSINPCSESILFLCMVLIHSNFV